MNVNEMTQIPHNFSKEVEWVFGAYEDAGVDLANGFQKDCIQNCTGARKLHSWVDWKCDIYLKTNSKGNYLIVEDSGTQGLTGPNLSSSEIKEYMDSKKNLPKEFRLARFSSMHNSGENETGAGTYGVGKIIYAVASQEYKYFFDSLTIDNKYVANIVDNGNIYKNAYEGDEAKKFIKESTGIEPKLTVGTRVIIVNPKEELVIAINNGTMAKYIQETWWRIIERLNGDSSGITINNVKVGLPELPKFENQYKLPKPVVFSEGFRVKHFELCITKENNVINSGIYYFRKGMRIGNIEINDVPEKIKGKFWGYIEVDDEWENQLAIIEDKVHFGVSKGKKNKIAYQYLKNYVTERFHTLMIEWKYIREKEKEDHKLKEELKLIAEELQNLFDSLGFEDLGKGSKKSDFNVRWQKIEFPKKESLEVKLNDVISFEFKISSNYITKRKFEYKLKINGKDNDCISTLDEKVIEIDSNKDFIKSISFQVNEENSVRFSENKIVLEVSVLGSAVKKLKELPFYFDISKPDNSREEITLTLNSCKFPREQSRRVNFNESLKDIVYRVENNKTNHLDFQLNVSIHDAREISLPKIMDVGSFIGTVDYCEETFINIPEIEFSESKLIEFLDKGELELRARVISLTENDLFEKGDKITSYKFKLFLNCDEKNGKLDSFNIKNIDAPNDIRRSWYETVGIDKTICLNTAHPAYIFIADNTEVQRVYIREQMLKQYVYLYLHEQKFSIFSVEGKELEEMDILESNKAIDRKIEHILTLSYK